MENIDFEHTQEKTGRGVDPKVILRTTWSYTKTIVKSASVALLALIAIFFITLWSFKWINPSSTAFTLQEDWSQLEKERYSLTEKWVDYKDIPQNIKWAVVASEDQKFWDHPGIDLVAIAEAYQEMENGERVRGASTITQQVAKNLFLSSDKNFIRKGVEAGLAVTIDALWGKERVLEMYLNIAEFGPGVYGIGEASDHFFAKDAKLLKDDESARMAAVLPNPKKMRVEPASPFVKERKDWILRNMMNLSGIAYYEAPKPKFNTGFDMETVQDSTISDTSASFDIPFVERLDISTVGMSVSTPTSSYTSVSDSTSADSSRTNNYNY